MKDYKAEAELFREVSKVITADLVTGKLYWKVSTNSRARAGHEAGCIHSNGYRCIRFDHKQIRAHRFIYWLVTGTNPPIIDHVNGVRDDNRPVNLREATHQQNGANSKASISGGSGFKGVSKCRGRWQARIRVNYQPLCLGTYPTPEEAARAYDTAALKHFGEYALLNFNQ